MKKITNTIIEARKNLKQTDDDFDNLMMQQETLVDISHDPFEYTLNLPSLYEDHNIESDFGICVVDGKSDERKATFNFHRNGKFYTIDKTYKQNDQKNI